jgi:hypothetical protein
MTRYRQNNPAGDPAAAALSGVPPLELLPADLAKIIEEIRALYARQREALAAVDALNDDAAIEAARTEDLAEHARQIRAGKRGVVCEDAQRKLAQDIAIAKHELEGVDAAFAAANADLRKLRDKAAEDPKAADRARKLAKTVQSTLDNFQAAYAEYDADDMVQAWLRGHAFQPIKPFPLMDLVSASRNGDRASMIGVDINDLVANLKKEILSDSDI